MTDLGFSWANGGRVGPDGSLILAPEKFGFESGEWVEQRMLQSLGGIVFDGKEGQWKGTQKVIGLCITKPAWGPSCKKGSATFEVSEAYIARIFEEIAQPQPRFYNLLPADCYTSPIRVTSGRQVQTSTPAAVEDSWIGADVAKSEPAGSTADAEVEPFGENFRTVPSCGRRFWTTMLPTILNLPSSESGLGR